jgi:transketolase
MQDGRTADVILMATGSEVHLAVAAYEQLTLEGVAARVVSLPCWELFDQQAADYRDEVLLPSVTARVAVEKASTLGWERYVGHHGAIVGMNTFGASAPRASAHGTGRVLARVVRGTAGTVTP